MTEQQIYAALLSNVQAPAVLYGNESQGRPELLEQQQWIQEQASDAQSKYLSLRALRVYESSTPEAMKDFKDGILMHLAPRNADIPPYQFSYAIQREQSSLKLRVDPKLLAHLRRINREGWWEKFTLRQLVMLAVLAESVNTGNKNQVYVALKKIIGKEDTVFEPDGSVHFSEAFIAKLQAATSASASVAAEEKKNEPDADSGKQKANRPSKLYVAIVPTFSILSVASLLSLFGETSALPALMAVLAIALTTAVIYLRRRFHPRNRTAFETEQPLLAVLLGLSVLALIGMGITVFWPAVATYLGSLGPLSAITHAVTKLWHPLLLVFKLSLSGILAFSSFALLVGAPWKERIRTKKKAFRYPLLALNLLTIAAIITVGLLKFGLISNTGLVVATSLSLGFALVVPLLVDVVNEAKWGPDPDFSSDNLFLTGFIPQGAVPYWSSFGPKSGVGAASVVFQTEAPNHTEWQKTQSAQKDTPDEIMPGLLLGEAIGGEECLAQDDVNFAILRCTDRPLPANSQQNQPRNCQLKVVSVEDSSDQDLLQHFDEGCDFIKQARRQGKTVLVHCNAGVSRSPTFVAAYLIRFHHLSAEEAINHVTNKRPCVEILPEFKSQLEQYAQRCRDREAGKQDSAAAAPSPQPESAVLDA